MKHEKIVDTGRKQPKVDPEFVAKALGAEPVSLEDLSPRHQAAALASRAFHHQEAKPPTLLLDWKDCGGWEEAHLGDFEKGDGVRFTLERYATCYRRGPWKLLIEVASGPGLIKWGCFDDQDQPVRWYHYEGSAKIEADAIAQVLKKDREARP